MENTAEDVLQELLDFRAPTPDVKIMLVDDEPVIIEVIKAILEDDGYTFVTFEAGEPALEVIGEEQPQLALVDKNLPGISGIDIVREGKKICPDTEFLIVTGYASVESAVEAMNLGAFGYITKPFRDPEYVRDNVQAALGRTEAVRQNRLLVDRLKSAFDEQYKTKIELDMLAGIMREKLQLRENEVAELVSSVLRPLAAADADIAKIAEYFEQSADSDGVGAKLLLGRAKMLEGLVTLARQRAEELSSSLEQKNQP